MAVFDLNLKPSDRMLRQFGWIALAGFVLIALLKRFQLGWLGRTLGAVDGSWLELTLVGVGVLSALFAVVYPRANRPLYLLLLVVTAPIGLVVSYLLMGVLFYLIVTPTGLVMRLLGRDPLKRSWSNSGTYWEKAPEARPTERYFRQF